MGSPRSRTGSPEKTDDLDYSFAPAACSTPRKPGTPLRKEYSPMRSESPEYKASNQGCYNPRISREIFPAAKPNSTGYFSSPSRPVYGPITPPSASNYARPPMTPPSSSNYARPPMTSPTGPKYATTYPIYRQSPVSPASTTLYQTLPSFYSSGPTPNSSKNQRAKSPQANSTYYPSLPSPNPKVTRKIVYETNYIPNPPPTQYSPRSSQEIQYGQQALAKINQLKQGFKLDLQNLEKRQAFERQKLPNDSYMKERHSIERDELEVEFRKNMLKQHYKIENALDATPTDTEFFDYIKSMPDTNQSAKTPKAQNYQSHNNTSRLLNSTNPNQTFNQTSYLRVPDGTATPRKLDFTSEEPSEMRNNNENKSSSKCGTNKNPKCKSCKELTIEELMKIFHNDVQKTILSASIRRNKIKGAVDCVKVSKQLQDCRQKKAQERAIEYLGIYSDTEILKIYHDLLTKRQQIGQGMNPYEEETPNSSEEDLEDLDEADTAFMEEFVQSIIEALEEDAIKMIAIIEDSVEMSKKQNDPDTLMAFQNDRKQIINQMEQLFVALWKEFESSCSCPGNESVECDELNLLVSNAIVEVLSYQVKLSTDLEKLLSEECTGCREKDMKQYQEADREELHNISVEIVNLMWTSLDKIKKILICQCAISPNPRTIFKAVVAINRKCATLAFNMLKLHRAKRRTNPEHEIDEDWNQLLQEIQDELNNIIGTLNHSNNTKMTCQEKNLAIIQEQEKQAIIDKYHTEGQNNDKMKQELAALNDEHLQQWNSIIASKLQRKIDKYDNMFPKDSKDSCSQTCSKRTSANDSEIDVNVTNVADSCECKTDNNEEDDNENGNHSQLKSDFDLCCEGKSTKDFSKDLKQKLMKNSNFPDLEDLNQIENDEMTVLQNNLRQWQIARRNLLESINRNLK